MAELLQERLVGLKDASPHLRATAAWSLAGFGIEAVPALVLALQDTSWRVRYAAAGALGEIGRKAWAAVPALIVALKDGEWLVRSAAATTLGKIRGTAAGAAVPALREALENDRQRAVRDAAARALGEIGE